jgi:catechol 2,3-dioxygenase-like lactoylglutathione lyase family enzyme
MNSLRLPPFRLIHAAYVTHDLEAGKRKLAEMFGMKEVSVYPEIEVSVPGGAAKIAFAVGDSNGMLLEVIQPLGGEDTVYRQVLPDDPADIAFHHYATRVDGEDEWQLVMDAAQDHGLEIVVNGGEEYGSRYLYLDTRAHLGHMLEFMSGVPDESEAMPEIEIRRERIA